MSVNRKDSRERQASRWAARLMKSVRAVLAVRPEADPDNVRHTLILLEQSPLVRLRRSLTRGRALAQQLPNRPDVSLGRHKLKVLRLDRILASKRAANRAKDRLVIPVLEDSLAASQLAARRGTRKASSPKKRKSSR
jgi:hypothetical protein